jgi:hypothetical protein
VEEPIDELYGAPLDEFVARRNELARALRKDGKRAQVDEVKALRKPTVAAWAVNVLARQERERVDALLEAGERLRAAHAKLLEGGEPSAVQEAAAAERKAVEELVQAAEGLLAGAGHATSPGTLDRVRDTLHAAAADVRVRELVREGRVVADEEATGFAFAGLSPPRSGAKKPRASKPDRAAKRERERRRAAEERVAEARSDLQEAERAVKDAGRALARAEKEADRRRAALGRAEQALERR